MRYSSLLFIVLLGCPGSILANDGHNNENGSRDTALVKAGDASLISIAPKRDAVGLAIEEAKGAVLLRREQEKRIAERQKDLRELPEKTASELGRRFGASMVQILQEAQRLRQQEAIEGGPYRENQPPQLENLRQQALAIFELVPETGRPWRRAATRTGIINGVLGSALALSFWLSATTLSSDVAFFSLLAGWCTAMTGIVHNGFRISCLLKELTILRENKKVWDSFYLTLRKAGYDVPTRAHLRREWLSENLSALELLPSAQDCEGRLLPEAENKDSKEEDSAGVFL